MRDVLCMGSACNRCRRSFFVSAILSANKQKLIASGVVDGIGGYGNPIGVREYRRRQSVFLIKVLMKIAW